jgi:hypothetical protein
MWLAPQGRERHILEREKEKVLQAIGVTSAPGRGHGNGYNGYHHHNRFAGHPAHRKRRKATTTSPLR